MIHRCDILVRSLGSACVFVLRWGDFLYAAVAAGHGLGEFSVENLNRRFAAAWKNVKDFNYTRPEWREIVDQTFEGLVKTPLRNTFFADLYSRFALPELTAALC